MSSTAKPNRGANTFFTIALGCLMVAIVLSFIRRGGGTSISLEEARGIAKTLSTGEVKEPIVAFVTEWCPVCSALEQYLQSQSISYIHADVEKNAQAGELFHYVSRKTGSRGVPQIVIGTKILVGFNPAQFEEALFELRSGPPQVQPSN